MTEAKPLQQKAAQTVTQEDVQQVAALANLELTADELPAMGRDLNAILGYIAQLNELDTSAVAPMAQVAEIVESRTVSETPMREDIQVPGLERAAVLRYAPETDGAFFKVPRVIER